VTHIRIRTSFLIDEAHVVIALEDRKPVRVVD